MNAINYPKSIAVCGAVLLTSVAVGAAIAPVDALAKQRPVLVVGERAADPETITRRVSFADLNLASRAGERVLNTRAGSAVRSVCELAVGGSRTSLGVSMRRHDCNEEAWEGARPQIAQAVLRAQQIAATGTSTLAATAIRISVK